MAGPNPSRPDESGLRSPEARPELRNSIYAELKRIAAYHMRMERRNHTLEPTALVHEAFLKLANQGVDSSTDRTHFRGMAANAMRQILVDHARAHAAQKRGGGWIRVSLDDELQVLESRDIDLVALDEALDEMARVDARKAQVVELRFFGGLTCAEIADLLGIAPKTAEADWYFARAWLRSRLSNSE